jgi:DNA polymerase-3 subunit delta'
MAYLEGKEMIGHERQRGFLARSREKGRHHAFLLVGPEHLGKDTVARALIADELKRPVASWHDLAGHPDVRVLYREEGEKNIGIEAIRGFIDHFASSSFFGGRKIGVISGAQDLSPEAANALLKTLEEPAGKALLVLVAHSFDRLPETVKSRCQVVRFLTVPPAEVRQGLVRRGADVKVAEVSAAFSTGRPGLAIAHAEDATLRAKHGEQVRSFMDLAGRPIASRLSAISEITSKAETSKLAALLDVWVAVGRDALSVATGNERYATDQAALPVLHSYVSKKSVADIVKMHRTLAAGKRMLGENVNPRIIFEHIAMTL